MDSAPVMVSANIDLVDVARMLLDADVSHGIVVDKRGRPVGMVSSTDILRAMDFVQQKVGLGASDGSLRSKRFTVAL
jgi:CBS domain-containing protein